MAKTNNTKQTNKNNGGETNNKQLIEICLNKLSNKPIVQTKHLVQLFGFNDGGKYIRRHLRKHFATNHEWNGNWVWKPNSKQLVEIIEYFVENQQIFNESKRATISSLNDEHNVNEIEIK